MTPARPLVSHRLESRIVEHSFVLSFMFAVADAELTCVVLLLADVEARFDMRHAADCGSLVD